MDKNRMTELDNRLRAAQSVPEDKPTQQNKSDLTFPDNHLEEDVSLRSTEVLDECEQADAYTANFIAASLRAQAEKMKPETHPDFDGETCVACGDDIPLERLKMFRVYCVDCQSKKEKRQKMFGG